MEQALIGVVVPVYKVEKYIAECIESILAQTYSHFRLILVDDGTPDNAGKICDEYAQKDKRITVIHQENAGVTRARARGVEEADDCEFVTFVDGDDTIEHDALTVLHNEMDNETDIVIGSHKCVCEDCRTEIDNVCYPNESINKDILLEILFRENYRTTDGRTIAPCPWGKLYRNTLFCDKYILDIPRDIVISEDLIMNIRLAYKTSRNIKTSKQFIYNYRQYSNSTFHTYNRTPENDHRIHLEKISSIPKEKEDIYIPQTIEWRLYRYRMFGGYSYSIKKLRNSDFYKLLEYDIKKYNYKIPLLERIIFHATNPMLRFVFINTKKILNIFYYNNK